MPKFTKTKLKVPLPNFIEAVGFTPTSGFTLLEVMAALMLFSIGILSVASLLTNGMNAITASRQRLYDTTSATGYLEMMMALDYDHDWLTDGRHGPFKLPTGKGIITWNVRKDVPFLGLKQILITIRSPARNNRVRSVSFEFLKSRGD